ncbi:MAG TPA: hypothetical protein DDW76_09590 [Cyanobacteria bacterium UBA11369]|nr:hypothetical protein [Cyanobacteria bacterium UBA11371]HBE34972.1 hypothetical protein [Cyanobacteria bacterium UBA11368]HBE49028.1 hypothetical protein [Cyanobacteria bacterium UBA11369]
MQVISITDLNSVVNPTRLAVPIDTEQQHFQLAMKQTCMKLPTEPLLDAHPQIDRWIMEVGLLFPKVFEWEPPQFLVDTQFIAKLCTKKKDTCVQINTNAVFHRNGYVNLIEWAIRHPVLNWSDKVKLWVATEYLSLPPENLKLTILALHPTHPGKRYEISWDSQQHEETRNWLVSVVTKQATPMKTPVASQVKSPFPVTTGADFDIGKIEEIEI